MLQLFPTGKAFVVWNEKKLYLHFLYLEKSVCISIISVCICICICSYLTWICSCSVNLYLNYCMCTLICPVHCIFLGGDIDHAPQIISLGNTISSLRVIYINLLTDGYYVFNNKTFFKTLITNDINMCNCLNGWLYVEQPGGKELWLDPVLLQKEQRQLSWVFKIISTEHFITVSVWKS